MIFYRIERVSPHPAGSAWRLLTRWERHARYVPLTSITVTTPPPAGAGTRFVARTGWGRAGFDDPMEVTCWEPPAPGAAGHCRLEKRGPLVRGWARIEVRPHGTGSAVRWEGALRVRGLPRPFDPVLRRAAALMYGRVVDALLSEHPPA